MKKLILMLLLAVPAVAFAQEKYAIQGKIGDLNPPTVAYLSYALENGSTLVDSSKFIDGAFRFSGQVETVTQGKLVIVRKQVINGALKFQSEAMDVFLVNGTTVISSPDLLKNASVTGTKANEDEQEYLKFRPDAKGKRAGEQQKDSLFIAGHPNSYVSLQLIKDMGIPYPDYNWMHPLFSMLSPEIRNSKSGIQLNNFLSSLKSVSIGEVAPDFTQPDTNGNPVKLSSLRGKYVLIDFWASWCGHCIEESPLVLNAMNTYKHKGFTVLGVSLDGKNQKNAWLNAIHKHDLTWINVCDLQGSTWDHDVAKLYGIKDIPQNVLLDPDGKIIAKNLHGEDLQQKLAALLDQKADRK